MNTQLKTILIGVVCVVVGVLIGYAMFRNTGTLAGAVSPVGTYQSGLRADYQSINTATAATTTGSFAIFNPSNDRIVESGFAFCTGVTAETQSAGVWALTAATSSVATTTNVGYAINLTLATTSSNLLVSSSTSGTAGTGINATNYIWPANSYLVFSFNATDTAVCTAGVKDIQL